MKTHSYQRPAWMSGLIPGLFLILSLNSALADGAVATYWEYLKDTCCKTPEQVECLEMTNYVATRSDGRRVQVEGVYRWRSPYAQWRDPDQLWNPFAPPRQHLLPHFVLGYLRVLRNAYEANPSDYFHNQLYNQIDYMVSEAVERPARADAILNPLVWENRYGITQGMEQAEMAAFLASAANIYAHHGAREAQGTMRYAFQAIESLFIPIDEWNGGVVSQVQDVCGAKAARFRPGYWFHSRGVGIDTAGEDKIATVLNQHLHVIYDALAMIFTVSQRPELVPAEYGSAPLALARLEDRAIGGLYQLAFSRGNNSAAPNRPPSMRQFMRRVEHPSQPHYFAWYRFDMSDRTFRNISWAKTCGYHTHSLEKLVHIKKILNDNHCLFLNSSTQQGWRLYEAMDRLLAGEGETMGLANSPHAVYQFWLSEKRKYSLVGCPCESAEDEGVFPGLFPHVWGFHGTGDCPVTIEPLPVEGNGTIGPIAMSALSAPMNPGQGIRLLRLPDNQVGVSWPISPNAGILQFRKKHQARWRRVPPPYITNRTHLSIIRSAPMEFYKLAPSP